MTDQPEIDLGAVGAGQFAPADQDATQQAPEIEPAVQEPPEPIKFNYVETEAWHAVPPVFNLEVETLDLPTALPSVATEVLSNAPNVNLENDAKAKNWSTSIGNSFAMTAPNEFGKLAAGREDASWEQTVETPVGLIAGGPLRFRRQEGKEYTGDAARMLIRSSLKLGNLFQVPLWHSGFFVTLRTPTEGELLDLNNRITQEKVTIGRQTFGLMFSNMMVYTYQHLLDFILEHVYETSLEVKDMSELRKHIRMQDLSALIWGLACATWPSGFQYRRACLSDPEQCHHVVEEMLNLSRLSWTDTTKLTQRQLKHMTNRTRASMTEDSVKTYVNDFLVGQNRLVKLTDRFAVEFRIPTAQEYIESGHRWVSGIENTYGRAMMNDPAQRDAYLIDQSRATMMRQYTHCVAKVVVTDEGGEVAFSDTDIIETTLNDLSARDNIREAFLKAGGEFIDNALVSFIAIPAYKCPACGGEQPAAKNTAYPGLIPLDVSQAFFRLLVQRLIKVRTRQIEPTWDNQISGS